MIKSTILLFGLTISAAIAAPLSVSRIPESRTPVIIDGVINENEWTDAAVLSDFCVAGTEKLSQNPITVKMKYDTEFLYFMFNTKIPFYPKIEAYSFDNLNYYTVDSIDIFIVEKDKNLWSKFGFERGGGKVDMKVLGQVRQPGGEWNPQWNLKSRILPQAFFAASVWEAEVSIPWKSLNIKPEKGMEIPIQIVHNYGDMRQIEDIANRTSSWASVGSIWYLYNPDLFGKIILGGEHPVFQFGGFSDFTQGKGGLKGKLTSKNQYECQARIWNWQNYEDTFLKKKFTNNSSDVKVENNFTVEKSTPALMSWNIQDKDGIISAGRIGVDLEPAFNVNMQPSFYQNTVEYTINLANLPNTVNSGDQINAKLIDKNGKKIADKTIVLAEKAKYAEISLSLDAALDMTEYNSVVTFLSKNKSQNYKTTAKFTKLPVPNWKNKNIGQVDGPFGPWREIKVEKTPENINVDILNNRYIFGNNLLPEIIRLKGDDFSSAPLNFMIKTEDGYETFLPSKPMEIVSQNKRGTTLRYTGQSKNLSLNADILVEFDGLAYYKLKIERKKSGKILTVHSASIQIKLNPEFLRYMRGVNAMATLESSSYYALIGKARTTRPLPRPDVPFVMEISGNGWKFDKNFNNFYWIGDDSRGMFVILPSRQNLFIRDSYSHVSDNPNEFEFNLNLIDSPVEMKNALEYEFGFLLTPSKVLSNPERLSKIGSGFTGFNPDKTRMLTVSESNFTGPFGWRFFHQKEDMTFPKDYLTTSILPCWLLPQVQCGNPYPPEKELKEIDEQISAINKSIGGSPMLWYDSLITMPYAVGVSGNIVDFERYPMARLMIESFSTLTCPTSAWTDLYLDGATRFLKQGIKSIYMDMSFMGPCSNRFHGCGYMDEHGEIKGKIPFLKAREMYLRESKLVKDNDPKGLLVLHASPATPIAVWMDVVTYGEEWTTAPDYSSLLLEFYQTSLTSRESLGTPTAFFPGLLLIFYQQAAKSSVTLAEVCGMTLLHNESMWNGVEHQMPGLKRIWDVQNSFGIYEDNVKFIPYYRNKLNDYPNGIAVSSYHKLNGEKLLVLFNPFYEVKTIGLDKLNSSDMTDMITGKKLIEKNLSLTGRNFMLVLCK